MKNLVLRSFKGRKRELRINIIMLTLIFMCGITTILFQESFYRSQESQRYDTYGEWTGVVFGAADGTEQLLNGLGSTKCLGKIVMLGSAWNNGEQIGEAGYVDQTAAALSRIQIAEGEMPSEDKEIALSETVVNRLPKQPRVGDNIEIASSKNLKSRYLVENLLEGGGVIVAAFGIVLGEFLIRLRKQNPYDSINTLLRSLNDNSEKIQLFITALFIAMVVFLGVSVVTLYIPLSKLSGRSIVENLGDDERR